MKTWKVILATLVIFATGVVTGGLIVKNRLPKTVVQPSPPPPLPDILQKRFLDRMKAELNLTPEQIADFEKTFAESRERMRILWDLVGPETRREVTDVREKIRAELRPDQREKFEALLKQQRSYRRGPGGPDDRRSRGDRGGSERGSNKSSAVLETTNAIPDR